jgi:steroid delta-isomerase-like uncharacterized protein
MTAEENIATMQRLVDEVIVGKQLSLIDELFAPDFIEHETLPGLPTGADGARAIFNMLHTGFPDLSVTVEQIMAQDDRVMFYMTWRGTHTGEFMGIPPTGKSAEWEVFDLVRLEDGKLAEHWGVIDQMKVMASLGLLPEPSAAHP